MGIRARANANGRRAVRATKDEASRDRLATGHIVAPPPPTRIAKLQRAGAIFLPTTYSPPLSPTTV